LSTARKVSNNAVFAVCYTAVNLSKKFEANSQNELSQNISDAKAGQAEAFERLMAQFYPPVFGLLCKWTGNWHDAEDLAQETFLKAYKYLARFRSGENFRAWLFQIAINLAHDLHRDRKTAFLTSPIDDAVLEAIDPEPAPEETLHRKQILQIIHQMLPEFSPRERSVFVLKTMEGLENDEIARLLGISSTTVRRFYGIVRQKIMRALEEQKPGLLQDRETRRQD
jgi:RNA polymerase sigma-70 factor, ECF subfamily